MSVTENTNPQKVTPALRKLSHTTSQGARTPGWPDVNGERLAEAMHVHPMHLRNVMTGREGTTLAYIERIAAATGMSPDAVVRRIMKARIEEERRIERADERWLARQEERRARKSPCP